MEEKNVFIINPIINEPIVIFGTGNNAKRAYFTLLDMDREIIGFADRDKELQGKKLFGKAILYEDELQTCNYSVVIASSQWRTILERLEVKGIKNIYIMNMYGENDRGIEI